MQRKFQNDSVMTLRCPAWKPQDWVPTDRSAQRWIPQGWMPAGFPAIPEEPGFAFTLTPAPRSRASR
jgi:hypothetical protein